MRLMSFDDKKRYLKRYSKMFDKFTSLSARLSTLENERAESNDPRCIMMINDTEIRLKRLYVVHLNLRHDTYEVIDQLDDSREIEVLEQFFIFGKTLVEIANEMGYSERHIIRIYKSGINGLKIER